jgi:hypothetical protein
MRIHITRGGSVQRPLTSGPRGWTANQTSWLASPTLQPLAGLHHRHSLQEAVTRNPKDEVGGSQTRWLAGHVARLSGQHLVTDLIKLVTPPWTLINTPLLMEFKTPHSTYSSPLLKVLV